MVALADVSRWYDKNIPVAAEIAPTIGETTNMRENEFVDMRAIDAGITSSAEISKVPMTRIVTKMVMDNIIMSSASTHGTRTPDV